MPLWILYRLLRDRAWPIFQVQAVLQWQELLRNKLRRQLPLQRQQAQVLAALVPGQVRLQALEPEQALVLPLEQALVLLEQPLLPAVTLLQAVQLQAQPALAVLQQLVMPEQAAQVLPDLELPLALLVVRKPALVQGLLQQIRGLLRAQAPVQVQALQVQKLKRREYLHKPAAHLQLLPRNLPVPVNKHRRELLQQLPGRSEAAELLPYLSLLE
jgi:hypothetical protein